MKRLIVFTMDATDEGILETLIRLVDLEREPEEEPGMGGAEKSSPVPLPPPEAEAA